MSNPPINISSLDFNSIKNNLIEYLKTTDKFKSYSFTGTAISSLLDVLAYNTLYYGFYANMIANESFLETAQLEENITKLLKPLGYTVNGLNASVMSVTLKGSPTLIPYQTAFNGLVGQNNYDFYPITEYTFVNASEEKTILLYEGTVNTTDITVDLALQQNQKYLITEQNIDINTLRVTVNGAVWEKYNPLTPKYAPTNNFYFIERNLDGFYILFSKLSENDVSGVFGTQLKMGDTIKIQYIIPSGSNANGCVLQGGVGTVVNSRASGGGGAPDLNTIKTFVPKLFSANERAVTKSDYFGVILELAKNRGLAETENEINVWGGEELEMPLYGRLFYSFNNTGLTAGNVKDITLGLKEKGVITVTPEYVPSQELTVNARIRYSGSVNSSTLKQKIDSYFSSNEFNKVFSVFRLTQFIQNEYKATPSAVTSISVTGLDISVLVNKNDTVISMKNNIASIRSETFALVDPTGGIVSGNYFFISDLDSPIIYLQKENSTTRIYAGNILNKNTLIFNTNIATLMVPASIVCSVTPSDITGDIVCSKRHLLALNSIVTRV
jgi:hypothetical protein